MSKFKLDICLTSDGNYARYLAVSILSTLKNKAEDDFHHFYILDGGLSEKNKKEIISLKKIADFEIEFIKIDEKEFESCPLPPCWRNASKATYYRLLLPRLLPSLDKVLFLDSDIIVQKSLGALFNESVENLYLKGVIDVESELNAQRLGLKKYCNSGVLLVNLKKWREDGVEKKFFDYVNNNTEKLKWADQDVLNAVLQDGIEYLDKPFNAQVSKFDSSKNSGFWEIAESAVVIHFVSPKKPWDLMARMPHRNRYRKYLFKVAPMKTLLLFILEPLALFSNIRSKIVKFRFNDKEKTLVVLGKKIF